MSQSNHPDTEELAYLLWEKQGRPENRAAANWLEAEEQRNAKSLQELQSPSHWEADLRSRGLGPLVQTPNQNNETFLPAVASKNPRNAQSASATLGIWVLFAVVLLWSLLRPARR